MDVVLVFLVVSGVLAIGYVLGSWHDEPDRAIREAILEQRAQRINQWALDRLNTVDRRR